MADYVNACSMIAFQNLLDDSLQAIVNKPVEALVVVAILPAIIEEFLFRGMIYRGIANKSNKKIVIIISALLFAFLHMKLFSNDSILLALHMHSGKPRIHRAIIIH